MSTGEEFGMQIDLHLTRWDERLRQLEALAGALTAHATRDTLF